MPTLRTLHDVEAFLAGLTPVVFADKLTAPQITPELLAYLDNPQEQYRVIHVAGTSGKTSTAYYAAALLQAAGKQVGLNISPHAETINERVQVNGRPLPEAEFCTEFSQFAALVAQSGLQPNYFQMITAFALWEFARQRVEYAVVEVGIGGLLDSTNVVARADKVCVITDIGLAHTGVLGETLPEIAAHKAGIIQLHNAVFARHQAEEIMASVRARAQAKQADLHWVDAVSGLGWLPPFQRRNFAMAEAAVDFVLAQGGQPPLSATQKQAAAHVAIPARMEAHALGKKTVVLDAAHNPQKIEALVQGLRTAYPGQKIAVLFAPTKGPRPFYEGMIRPLLAAAAHLTLTNFLPDEAGRFGSADPAKLAGLVRGLGGQAAVIPDVTAAFHEMQNRPEPILLVTGSFYLLNHVRPLLERAKRATTS